MSESAEAGRAALVQILKRMELVAQTNVEVANRIAAQQRDLVDAYSQATVQARATNALLAKLCERLGQVDTSSSVLADALDGVPVLEARAQRGIQNGGRSLASQAIQGLMGGVMNSVAPPYRQQPPPGWRPQGRPY